MVKCEVLFEHDETTGICAGSLLKGLIEITISKPTKFRSLSCVVYGAAKTNIQKHSYLSNTTTIYRDKELLLQEELFLFGHRGASKAPVAIGTTHHAVSFKLPDFLPATFSGFCYGYSGTIAYKVKIIKNGGKTIFEKYFKVYRIDDLNEHPVLKIPRQMEESSSFSYLIRGSDRLRMNVQIPFTGFVADQTIPIKISYDNRSSTTVKATKIKLWSTTVYSFNATKAIHKSKRKCLAKYKLRGIEKHESDEFTENIELPAILMSSTSGICKIIQVFHELEITAVVSWLKENLKLSMPIRVGTVPLNFG